MDKHIAENKEKEKGCYFDEQNHGWVRFGNFFPFEIYGNYGPFFHDAVSSKKNKVARKHS